MNTKHTLLALILLAGCHVSHNGYLADEGPREDVNTDTSQDNLSAVPYAQSTTAHQACLDEGDSCYGKEEACCAGSQCAWISYGESVCIKPKPDGGSCQLGAECESHRCREGICRATECAHPDQQLECSNSADCCRGFCDNSGYGFGLCRNVLNAGERCVTNDWCASRACNFGRCE